MMEDKVTILSLSRNELEEIVKCAVKNAIDAARSPERELLDAKSLCELLGISSSCLSNWKKEGRIPYKRLGARIFFSRSEVLESLKGSKYHKLNE